jgi:hypothetical protein
VLDCEGTKLCEHRVECEIGRVTYGSMAPRRRPEVPVYRKENVSVNARDHENAKGDHCRERDGSREDGKEVQRSLSVRSDLSSKESVRGTGVYQK